MSKNRQSGFTLTEIMIVVLIIGMLAAMAIPAFQKSRERSQNYRFYNDCRVFAAAAQMFILETGAEYPDPNTGDLPVGMDEYIQLDVWQRTPSIGGSWDFDNEYGFAGVGSVGHTMSASQAAQMESMDDGDPSTGTIRTQGDRVYYSYASIP